VEGLVLVLLSNAMIMPYNLADLQVSSVLMTLFRFNITFMKKKPITLTVVNYHRNFGLEETK